jgi:hypothetical protein
VRSYLIPLQIPQILAGNSDLHIVLQFIDQPPFRNAQFVTVMQRVFDSYRLALTHLTSCRSLRRLQRGLLTVEFPVHEACPKAQFQLHAEIVWHDGDSLRILATACRFPRFKKQILIKTIGRKDSPRISVSYSGRRCASRQLGRQNCVSCQHQGWTLALDSSMERRSGGAAKSRLKIAVLPVFHNNDGLHIPRHR